MTKLNISRAGRVSIRRRSFVVSACVVSLMGACAASDDGETSTNSTNSAAPVATNSAQTVGETAAPQTQATVAPTDPTETDPTETAATGAGAETTEPTTEPTEPITAPTIEPEGEALDGQTAIVVDSTADQYFVLYVRPDASSDLELAVAVTRGEDGTTTLTDGRAALPDAQYRYEAFDVTNPGDVDGDGIDDLTELDDPVGANPLNGAPALDADTGAVIISDRATYEALSYQGDEVARDAYLAGIEFMKFWIIDADTDNPKVYFMNTEEYKAHPMFAEAVGIQGGRGPVPGKMRGDIAYAADEVAPDGTLGRFRFAFQPNDAYSYAEIALAYEALVNGMPELGTKLFYYPFPQSALPLYEHEKELYDAGRVPVLVE